MIIKIPPKNISPPPAESTQHNMQRRKERMRKSLSTLPTVPEEFEFQDEPKPDPVTKRARTKCPSVGSLGQQVQLHGTDFASTSKHCRIKLKLGNIYLGEACSSNQPPPRTSQTQPVIIVLDEDEPAVDEMDTEGGGLGVGEKSEVFQWDLNALYCLFCSKALCEPVYQCVNRHLACGECYHQNRRCRFCERLLYGCTDELSYLKLDHDHETTCKNSLCYCPDCSYVGQPWHLYNHFLDEHEGLSELISFNSIIAVEVSESVHHVFFHEEGEGIIFIVNRFRHDPVGCLVNVVGIASSSSKVQFVYELRARAGERSISTRALVELTPEISWQLPDEQKCFVVTSDYYDEESCTYEPETIKLELIISKLK